MGTNIALVLSRGVTPVDKIDWHTMSNCMATIQELFKMSETGKIIIFPVGGIFQPENVQKTPISILMEKFIKRNIETTIKFLYEEESLDTWQNIENFDAKIKQENIDVSTVYVFADKFHSKRVEILLKYYGYKNIVIPKSHIELSLKEKIKEIFFIIATFIDPSGIKNPIIRKRLEKERRKRRDRTVYLNYR